MDNVTMAPAVLGYIVVLLIVFGRTLFPPDGYLIFGDDIHRQYYFYRQFFNSFFTEGILPWWNPYLFAGTPFIANPVVNIWYPPTWLFFFLPLHIAYSWHIAFHILWAMLGMYTLLRRVISNFKFPISNEKQRLITHHSSLITQFDLGPWVGGLVFGLSGFFAARIWAGHVDVIAAASWMPWVFAAFWRITNPTATKSRHGVILSQGGGRFFLSGLESRRVAVAAGVFALQLLAGYQTMAMLTVEAVFIVTLLHCYIVKKTKPLVLVCLSLLLSLGLASVQILPMAQFIANSIRTFKLPYSWVSYGAISWESLKQLLNPFHFGNQITYAGPAPNFIEHSMFVGVGGLVLALVGVIGIIQRFARAEVGISWFSRRQGPDRLFFHNGESAKAVTALETTRLPARILGVSFIIVTLFGLWASLGPNAPVDLQYILWKIFPMYHVLRIPSRHLILFVFGLAGLAGIGLDTVLRSVRRGSCVIKAQTVAAVWSLLSQGRNDASKRRASPHVCAYIVSLFIVAVITYEMVQFGRNFIDRKPVPEARHDAELIALLKQDKEPYRVLQNFGVWLPQREVLDFDSVMSYGIFSATGYDPSILRSYYEYVARSTGSSGEVAVLSQDVQVPYFTPAHAEAIDALNIKYIMVPPEYDPFSGNTRYRLIRDDSKNDYRLYENTTVLPRFYLRDRSCGSAVVSSYTPNRIELAVDSTCDTTLMSSEVWYPGWRAFVDREKVHIVRSNLAFRALPIPGGNHTVVYRFVPTVFLWGGVISVLSITVCLWFLWRSRPNTS